MITGAIWEKTVFGQYLLAKSFFWEDVVSFFVIAFHSLYLFVLFTNFLNQNYLIGIALIAYFIYLVNAIQFLIKFKLAKKTQLKDISSADGVMT